MKHLVTALIVISIFVLASLFGLVLIENRIHASSVVGSVSEVNMYGVYFLVVVLTVCSCVLSYMVIDLRKV